MLVSLKRWKGRNFLRHKWEILEEIISQRLGEFMEADVK